MSRNSPVVSVTDSESQLPPEPLSSDKLEIQLEEETTQSNENTISAEESGNIQNGDMERDSQDELKTKKKSKLSIKMPQILRKRSKERPLDKDQKEVEDEKEMFPLSSDATSTNGNIIIPNASEGMESKTHDLKDELKEVTSGNIENGVDEMDVSTTTIRSTFSTPRWTNFRRVFSFNRSTPAQLGHEKGLEGVVPVSVVLNIPEDAVKASLKGTGAEDVGETKEPTGEQVEPPGGAATKTPPPNNLLTPLLRLFRDRQTTKAPQRSLDLESGTELLEKNDKTLTDQLQNGFKGDKTEFSLDMNRDEEKIPGKLVSEEGVMTVERKVLEGGESPLKSTPHAWRERVRRSWNVKKVVLAIVAMTLFVVVTILVISICPSSQAINIGTLIIAGKYINTITSCGHVQGVVEDGGYVFRGLPYALPPTGELRWRPAQTHSHLSHCWNGTFHAKNHSMPCWQFYRNGSYDGSEDCLYLDVYTPKPYYDSPLPVVVFIGGESLNGGQSGSLRPSAKLAVQKNVVFVTVSIRRSVLGFLTVDLLSQNSYPITSGNYGLSDLLAALHWVKINAMHFGGDPHHVTLLGHQSGASLVLALLSSHLSQGLFHQVWTSGGSPPTSLINVQEAEAQNTKFLEEIACSSIECLHNKGPEELLESVPNDWRMFHQDLPNRGEKRHHWLVRDGIILREPLDPSIDQIPRSQLPSESLINLPFVAGAAAEVDASSEMFSYLNWNDTTKFSTYLESSLGSFGPSLSREVMDRYFRPESTPWQTFASLLSDVRTICPLYYTAISRADPYVELPVYFYVVTQRKASPIGFVADGHADISAIFGTYTATTREEKKFVGNIQKLFYDFVEKGHLPHTPDVTKSIIKVDENIQKIYTYPNCDFWQDHHFFPNHSRID